MTRFHKHGWTRTAGTAPEASQEPPGATQPAPPLSADLEVDNGPQNGTQHPNTIEGQ